MGTQNYRTNKGAKARAWILLCSVVLTTSLQSAVNTDGPANILLIIADDLGVDNVSIYAEQPINMAHTPNIDALANGGVFFRNAWANPKCSPSRASIYTGRHAFRHGVTSPGALGTLSTVEENISEVLADAGYATALFGKWHLGNSSGATPTGQGTIISPARSPISEATSTGPRRRATRPV